MKVWCVREVILLAVVRPIRKQNRSVHNIISLIQKGYSASKRERALALKFEPFSHRERGGAKGPFLQHLDAKI